MKEADHPRSSHVRILFCYTFRTLTLRLHKFLQILHFPVPISFLSQISRTSIMDSAAALRSFHYPAGTTSSRLHRLLELPRLVNATLPNDFSSIKRGGVRLACAKAAEVRLTPKSEDSSQNGSVDQKSSWRATFPSAFQELVTEVCDDTEIAELKLKVGGFEMNLKRNLASKAPPPVIPFIPSEPTTEAAPPATQTLGKPSSEKVTPFTNVSPEKASKLAALEASGASGYVLVASPVVGSFKRSRTLKGKEQPPACKEGDIIKEGQVVGFLDQFGNELSVKSDVAGKVLKFLFEDGEAVGYGDPLIAVLP